ncbi:tocopherol cyclase family protein [Anaerosporobacter faecicola]|uniref:tocopherol cyclase family protein n=1 Tax=Anaerosporobacter faecicola TaxID=2718714 RepID=UPI00143B7793|nr:tocopherol cyclase family protein [Anaerosporobacter faecicola]
MNQSDLKRNLYMLHGPLANQGYDWWWHSFTAYHEKTGEAKAFYIEFFLINPTLAPESVVLGQDPDNQAAGIKPSYCMIHVGTWGKDHKQLHAYYPVADVKMKEDVLSLEVDGNQLTEQFTCGKVLVTEDMAMQHPEYMSDAGEMEWNLKIHKKICYNVGYGASKFFRSLNAFEMFWHAEGMKTEYEGTICFNGEYYQVIPEKSFGYADKNWGKNFTSPWVWISSCNLYSHRRKERLKNSVFEVGGGRPKVFGIPMNRKLLIDFYYEGKEYEFNFSKFWMLVRTKFHCYETANYVHWKVKTENATHILIIQCRCRKEEMLKINYEAPDGSKKHKNLWNGGTGEGKLILYKKQGNSRILIDRLTFHNAGCEYGEYE